MEYRSCDLGRTRGDWHEEGNRELEEWQVNNDIESQLENTQCKLTQRNKKCSRERSQKIMRQICRGFEKKSRRRKLITVSGAPIGTLK